MAWMSILKIRENFKEDIDAIILSSPTNNDPGLLFVSDYASKALNCKNIQDWSDRHHLCHASLAFYNSGFEKASVIVIDRNGSVVENVAREAETIFTAEYPDVFTEIYKNYWTIMDDKNILDKKFEKTKNEKINCEINYYNKFSITKVYETATILIGQDMLENGKTMGLSAYGKPSNMEDFFIDNFSNDLLFMQLEDGSALNKKHIDMIVKDLPRNDYELYADYAYAVQRQTEQQVEHLVKKSIEKTGIKKICLTGGYGLNVVCNGYLINKFPDVEFYFEPLADDSGNSMGAAMLYYRQQTKDMTINKIKTTFVHGIENSLSDISGSDFYFKDVALSLSNNESVAIYNGLAESGPRALGNRSILYNALDNNAKEVVNIIKKREWYRPFAAAVLLEDAKEYFDMKIDESPHMTASFSVKENYKELLYGVMHVDGSCRIQTVSNDNSPLRKVLESLKEITGHGIVLNTSFNLAGEPLVETPDQAISILKNSSLDKVWFPEINKCVSK